MTNRAALALHLFALSAAAVAQPLFDVLSRSPEFFVAHRLTPLDIVVVTLLVCVAPPVVILVLGWLVGRGGRRAQVWVEQLGLAVLAAALALLVIKQSLPVDGVPAVAAAVVLGAVATVAYRRFAAVGLFVTILAAGVVLFPGWFLLASPVSRLLSAEAAPVRPAVGGESTTPVVVVVFDQLPLASLTASTSEIDATRYPNFAELAAGSLWFRQASAVGNYTGWALPPILTGRYPAPSLLPTLSDHPENLFTLLAASHDPHVLEPITALCPASVCPPARDPRVIRVMAALSDLSVAYLHILLPSDLTRALPPVTQSWKDFVTNDTWHTRWIDRRDDDRRRGPRELIAAIEPRGQLPPFYFLHVLLPHEPYMYLPTGQVFESTRSLPELATGGAGSTMSGRSPRSTSDT